MKKDLITKRAVITLLAGLMVFSFCVILSQSALAQKGAQPTSSLLYKVTGKGLAKPSYIFGTFHAICSPDMVPLVSLDPFLSQTDQLLMEVDMDDPVEMASMASAAVIAGGKNWKDLLTADEFASIDAMLKDLIGLPADAVKTIKPVMISILAATSPKAIGCATVPYDSALMKSAVSKNKPVIGLESVASQISVLDTMPLDKQAKDLYKMAVDRQKSINELRSMMALYKERDADKLYEFTKKTMAPDIAFQTKLLDDRNVAWIPKLETAFKAKPTFVAVGVGHLGGVKGVIQLLRSKGYRVSPVKI